MSYIVMSYILMAIYNYGSKYLYIAGRAGAHHRAALQSAAARDGARAPSARDVGVCGAGRQRAGLQARCGQKSTWVGKDGWKTRSRAVGRRGWVRRAEAAGGEGPTNG